MNKHANRQATGTRSAPFTTLLLDSDTANKIQRRLCGHTAISQAQRCIMKAKMSTGRGRLGKRSSYVEAGQNSE